MIQRSGDWQPVSPSEWKPREKIATNVGLSAGERRRATSSLKQVIQMQMEMITGGTANITTNWNQVHRAIMDWLQAAELTAPEQYFLDPDGQESQAGQQAQMAQQQQAQADQQQLLDMQTKLAEFEAQLEQGKVQLDRYEHDTQLAHDYWSELLKADTADADRETVGESQARELRASTSTEGPNSQNGRGG